MPNIVGHIPEFTADESVKGAEEVKEAPAEKVVEEEKETPAEPPAEEKPAEEEKISPSDDIGMVKQVEGLLREKEKLLQEIQSLRGDRRELKQAELAKVEQKMDDIKDVHPEDAALIEKILKQKGYMTQQEVNSMFYKAVEQDEVRKFLEKYPEYKPENDKNDINWSSLNREFSDYRKPDDPRRIGELLEKAHRVVSKPSSDRTLEARRQQVKTASVGGGGVQRSSSTKQLDPEIKMRLKDGGFTDEDIKNMESRLE